MSIFRLQLDCWWILWIPTTPWWRSQASGHSTLFGIPSWDQSLTDQNTKLLDQSCSWGEGRKSYRWEKETSWWKRPFIKYLRNLLKTISWQEKISNASFVGLQRAVSGRREPTLSGNLTMTPQNIPGCIHMIRSFKY